MPVALAPTRFCLDGPQVRVLSPRFRGKAPQGEHVRGLYFFSTTGYSQRAWRSSDAIEWMILADSRQETPPRGQKRSLRYP
jgi:hypothetical protein